MESKKCVATRIHSGGTRFLPLLNLNFLPLQPHLPHNALLNGLIHTNTHITKWAQ